MNAYTKNSIIRQYFVMIQTYEEDMKVKDISSTVISRRPKSNPRALLNKIIVGLQKR